MRWAGAVALSCFCWAAGAVAQDIALRPFESTGFDAMKRSDFAGCARKFAKAAWEHRQEPSPPFVAARCYARAANMEKATRYLRMSLDRGYRNCTSLEREPALATVSDASARCAANAEAFVRSVNPELLVAYLSDRADRSGPVGDAAAIVQRDHARQNVVRISIEQNALRTADDYLHAALIMQHGSTPEAYALARKLAEKAVQLRPWLAEARWLYAAATDRYLQSTGKPQIFGTQYKQVNGQWTLEPFDPAAISDAERARWRAHSLAERLKFIEEVNRGRQ